MYIPRLTSAWRLPTGWTVRRSNPVGARFSTPVQTGPETHPASCAMGTGSFPGGKMMPGRDADPSPPSSAEVKNRVELYLYSPSVPSWPVKEWNLPKKRQPAAYTMFYNVDGIVYRDCAVRRSDVVVRCCFFWVCFCVGVFVICVLVFTVFVLFRSCIFILICFVCISVRTTAIEWNLNCRK